MKFLVKYWAQITGILAILAFLFGWCWRLAVKFDSLVTSVQQNTSRLDDHDRMLAEHDQTLDEHDHRLIPLETKETLREQGLMK
jgi:hypothetical protein